MGNLTNALQQLRAERQVAQLHVEKLAQAISVIESLNGLGASGEQTNRGESCRQFRGENGAGSKGEMGKG